MRHQVEVVVVRMSDVGVDDCAGADIAGSVTVLRCDGEESGKEKDISASRR